MPAKFQIHQAKNGKFFFNLQAANGEVILTSQMYATKATAKKGIASVQANAEAEQFEQSTNKGGKHYFVMRAKNKQIIGTGQAYSDKSAAKKGIKSVCKSAPNAKVEDATKAE